MSDQIENTEWNKLDEHLHGKKVEEGTFTALVTRYDDKVTLSNGDFWQSLDLGEVKLNGVLLYDTRTWKTGDVVTMMTGV